MTVNMPHLQYSVIWTTCKTAHYTHISINLWQNIEHAALKSKDIRWHKSTVKLTGFYVIVPGSCKLGRKVVEREQQWVGDQVQSLVSKGLTHCLGNTLGTDAEDVQKLLGLSATRNTAHCQPSHDNAGLWAHCWQHCFTKTTWTQERNHQNLRAWPSKFCTGMLKHKKRKATHPPCSGLPQWWYVLLWLWHWPKW